MNRGISMKIRTVTLATVVIGIAALSVKAGTPFSDLDANNDGYISESEAKSNSELLAAFGKLDKDGDKQLSEQEFAAFKGSK